LPAIALAGRLQWERLPGGISPRTTVPEAAPPAFVQYVNRVPLLREGRTRFHGESTMQSDDAGG
jgi:hypothetical protein